jgi:hypothetical protein
MIASICTVVLVLSKQLNLAPKSPQGACLGLFQNDDARVDQVEERFLAELPPSRRTLALIRPPQLVLLITVVVAVLPALIGCFVDRSRGSCSGARAAHLIHNADSTPWLGVSRFCAASQPSMFAEASGGAGEQRTDLASADTTDALAVHMGARPGPRRRARGDACAQRPLFSFPTGDIFPIGDTFAQHAGELAEGFWTSSLLQPTSKGKIPASGGAASATVCGWTAPIV